mmetsp:Transcript_3931/g.9968  ORF Transcript_3931/g.9968 Transcript_3931/m.9968 type:complete len:230 (-) Transcript_3931:250-939(-)
MLASATRLSSWIVAESIEISPSNTFGRASIKHFVPTSKRVGRRVVACSFSSISKDSWVTIGPASILDTVNSTETPTGLSPASNDRCTGLAPLHLGNNEGCIFKVPNFGRARKRFGKYCPYAAVMHRSGLTSFSNSSKKSLSRAFSGQRTGSPNSSATRPTGDGISFPRRLRRLGGWVTTPTNSYCDSALWDSSYRDLREEAATSGVPRNNILALSPRESSEDEDEDECK